MTDRTPGGGRTIGFRCSEEEYDALALAAAAADMSPGLFVKHRMLAMIASSGAVADEVAFTAADRRSVARAVWALFKLRTVELDRDGRQADIDTAVALAKEKFR